MQRVCTADGSNAVRERTLVNLISTVRMVEAILFISVKKSRRLAIVIPFDFVLTAEPIIISGNHRQRTVALQ